ncbi:hypothetical protein PMZ80_009047 [Knufia obscura]|uniref:Uncharacterized protein n=1 Tax=Knufia obscura TaxID=1635080 RepID=A0ABR0RF22_9EURO|nr:hypothetical protein PMZ80_009047 [Knufia obscura]
MASETEFTPDHSDRLTVLQLNNDSSKLLTASIDHRIAVYDIDRTSGTRKQLDLFTAHDAEIRDVKWFHPSTGTHFVTIANDLQLRIWSQDTYQAPMSGRRFRRIATLKSEQLVPFASVDTKTVGNNIYIVVIDRQGLLSLYEPTNPDEYNEWSLVDQLHVCSPTPGRGDHTSFRVRFDPNPFPLPFSSSMSEDQGQLTIAVTALNEAKLYRTTSDPDLIRSHVSLQQQTTNLARGASRAMYLFEVLRIPHPPTQYQTSAGTLLRDIAFSPANIHGRDILAISSINGTVAVYEISLQSRASSSSAANSSAPPTKQPQPHQSNLTSALNPQSTSSPTPHAAQSRSNHPLPYTHHATPISIIQDAHLDAWSVQWDPSGETLLSSGSDGTVKVWKRMISGSGVGLGGFELVAEQAGEDESESDEGSVGSDEGRG